MCCSLFQNCRSGTLAGGPDLAGLCLATFGPNRQLPCVGFNNLASNVFTTHHFAKNCTVFCANLRQDAEGKRVAGRCEVCKEGQIDERPKTPMLALRSLRPIAPPIVPQIVPPIAQPIAPTIAPPIIGPLDVKTELQADPVPPLFAANPGATAAVVKNEATDDIETVDELSKVECMLGAPTVEHPKVIDPFARSTTENKNVVEVNIPGSTATVGDASETENVGTELKKSFTVPDEYLDMYRKVTCEVCPEPKKFESTLTFYKHMTSEHKIKIFKCARCDESFYSHGPLRRHNLNVHAVGVLSCLPCNKWRFKTRPPVKFPSAEELLKHMKVTHPGSEFQLLCPSCKEEIVVPGDLEDGLNSFTTHWKDCRREKNAKQQVIESS